MTRKYNVNIYEFERGWGNHLDEVKEFDTEEEALAFVQEFNRVNDKPYVPDWYMVAEYCG